jgi:hypothetical protein
VDDTEALEIALRRMNEKEGELATRQLMSECNRAVATRADRRLARRLKERVPGYGESTALDVLGAIGRLLCDESG